MLTLAVRDYGDDDEEFTAGIDAQLDVVRQWWPADGGLASFQHIPAPEPTQRRDIENFLEDHKVREMTGKALVMFVTGHGISGGSRIHFLKLPGTQKGRVLATAMRTSDIVMAALDSHVENVLVIVNTCYAGQIAAELQALYTEIARGRRRACQLDVLVTCGHDQPVQVHRFPSLMKGVFHRLRTSSQITTPFLSVAELMSEVERELATPEQQELHRLHRVIDGSPQTAPSPCIPNPGYRPLRTLVGAGRQQVATNADDYWLERATGRPHDEDSGWYFRGREHLNRQIASFLATNRSGVLLVTGTAGSGKSAVLARAVTLSEPRFLNDPAYQQALASAPAGTVPPPGSVTTAVLARHRGPGDVARDLLTGLGQAPLAPGTPQESGDPVPLWTQQLTAYLSTCCEPVTIVLDGLDEADEPHRIIHDVLEPLSSLCEPAQPASALLIPGQRTLEAALSPVRLLIGIRSGLPDHGQDLHAAAEANGLFESLRQIFPDARSERTDDISSQNDIADYVHALICDGGHRPGADKAAAAVAPDVWPSFADARLAGEQLRAVDDPEAEVVTDEWRTTLRRGTTGLLQRDLMLLQAETGGEDGKKLPADVALALLRASAWAYGGGVPWSDIWPAMASAILQRPLEDPDTMIKKLLDSRLAGYLAWGVEDNRRVYRPAHEAVAQTLRDPKVEDLLSGESL
ncbi:AAA family ATPase [Streptomyces sp. NPDC101150]|uniref:AAA family ATPase n=1 Tax=Streptomyces sp. NPDC101150 TaxID=3366114 RepID=UPI0038126CA4